MSIVYLNGDFIPLAQASISVMDRGFLFGDGVYEVIPVYHKKPFLLAEHLQRLEKSLHAIQLEMQMNLPDWEKIFATLIEKNLSLYGEHQAIYFQITRGVAPERLHTFPHNIKPTLFAQSIAPKTLSAKELAQGLQAITLPDTRWQHCDIKSTALLANILLYQQAKHVGAQEAILLRDGFVTEASTSNVFIVNDNVIKTPPLSNYLLAGITREFILKLARKNKIACAEIAISEENLRDADEVWITSSTREIYPIVAVDKKLIGNGKPGAMFKRMLELYRAFIG